MHVYTHTSLSRKHLLPPAETKTTIRQSNPWILGNCPVDAITTYCTVVVVSVSVVLFSMFVRLMVGLLRPANGLAKGSGLLKVAAAGGERDPGPLKSVQLGTLECWGKKHMWISCKIAPQKRNQPGDHHGWTWPAATKLRLMRIATKICIKMSLISYVVLH